MSKVLKKLNNRLILVGVAHVLPKSMAEVRETISKEKPEVVGVELCPSRYLILTSRARGSLGKPQGGQLQSTVFSRLIYLLQKRVSQQTGMPAGEEMLTAVNSAREIGARVELLDQDINLTLQRLVSRMGLREKMRLGLELLLAFVPFGNRVKLETVMEEQVIGVLLAELKRTSPTSYEVLIQERDEFMAAKIERLVAASSGKVVCVVGAGHIPGIYRQLAAKAKKGLIRPWSTFQISWQQF